MWTGNRFETGRNGLISKELVGIGVLDNDRLMGRLRRYSVAICASDLGPKSPLQLPSTALVYS